MSDPTLFQRDEGVEPRFLIVCYCHTKIEQMTTNEAIAAGVKVLMERVGECHVPTRAVSYNVVGEVIRVGQNEWAAGGYVSHADPLVPRHFKGESCGTCNMESAR